MTKPRYMGLVCLLLGVLLEGGCGHTSSLHDGQTHWLRSCTSTRDCLSGLVCQCGLCMQPCDDDSACDAVSDGASCQPSDSASVGDLCGSSPTGLCLDNCTTSSDCASEQACVGGACVPASGAGGAGGAPGCFSPERNLDPAYEPGSQGCECNPDVDTDVCVADSTGRMVALSCSGNLWSAVEDGACSPLPRANCSEGSCLGDAVCAEVVPGGFMACVGKMVAATTCYDYPVNECCEDSDCASGACLQSVSYGNGPCGLGGATPINQCLSDECDSDVDCGAGAVCAWRGVEGVRRVCIDADCESDGDCDAGGECVLVEGGCLNDTTVGMVTFRPPRLACAYRADFCTQDLDCSEKGGGYCVVEAGKAHCQADAGF